MQTPGPRSKLRGPLPRFALPRWGPNPRFLRSQDLFRSSWGLPPARCCAGQVRGRWWPRLLLGGPGGESFHVVEGVGRALRDPHEKSW